MLCNFFIELGSCSLRNRNDRQSKRVPQLRCFYFLIFWLIVVYFFTLELHYFLSLNVFWSAKLLDLTHCEISLKQADFWPNVDLSTFAKNLFDFFMATGLADLGSNSASLFGKVESAKKHFAWNQSWHPFSVSKNDQAQTV